MGGELQAARRRAVRRALIVAVGVGAILISVNQLDVILRGDVTPLVVAKMVLTPVVPFFVSLLSSLAALRERSRNFLVVDLYEQRCDCGAEDDTNA